MNSHTVPTEPNPELTYFTIITCGVIVPDFAILYPHTPWFMYAAIATITIRFPYNTEDKLLQMQKL